MDTVLQKINKYFVSLSPDEVQENSLLVDLLMGTIIPKMKAENPLFKALFREVFWGGSFYDHLKICRAEEYDLDLLLLLPKNTKPVLKASDIPGSVCVQLLNLDGFLAEPEVTEDYEDLRILLDADNYLSTQNVMEWMEGILKKIFFIRDKEYEKYEDAFVSVYFSRSGPALTLYVGGEAEIKVDLVPSFVFDEGMWPKKGFRPNPVPRIPEFSIVPKKPKSSQNQPISRYWRLSFQEQERWLIRDKMFLKPTLRLLKKMRDKLGHNCIASYYLKTVVLHLVDREDISFWRKPLSWVFMNVLEEYRACIARKSIPYYWNKEDNLIEGVDQKTLEMISQTLTHIVNEIQVSYFDQPERVAVGVTKYLLTADERDSIFYDIMLCSAGAKSREECIVIFEEFEEYTKNSNQARFEKSNNPQLCCFNCKVLTFFLVVLIYVLYSTEGNFGK